MLLRDAVEAAGVASAVGFNYRNAPAVERARELVVDGALGEVTNARVQLFSDYAAHPDGALTWRFERATGGAGVLGDLASHGVDLVRFLLGDLEQVVADTAVFVPRRPRPVGAGDHFARGGGEPGAVENEDFVSALLRTRSGVRVTLEASRVAVGEQNSYSFSVHGSRGSLAWDFRRMGELQVAVNDGAADYQDVATTTVLVGPGHGELGAFQPGAGIAMGYDDLKVIEAARFLRAALGGEASGATVQDAVACRGSAGRDGRVRPHRRLGGHRLRGPPAHTRAALAAARSSEANTSRVSVATYASVTLMPPSASFRATSPRMPGRSLTLTTRTSCSDAITAPPAASVEKAAGTSSISRWTSALPPPLRMAQKPRMFT